LTVASLARTKVDAGLSPPAATIDCETGPSLTFSDPQPFVDLGQGVETTLSQLASALRSGTSP
jgi:hypothetical protein